MCVISACVPVWMQCKRRSIMLSAFPASPESAAMVISMVLMGIPMPRFASADVESLAQLRKQALHLGALVLERVREGGMERNG